jgi:peroxiredoxin
MALDHDLNAVGGDFYEKANDSVDEHIYDRAFEELRADKLVDKAIKTGDVVPVFFLKDISGRSIGLSETLKSGPVILLFIRGHWCPYCIATLRAYQGALSGLKKFDGQLIVVTPEKPNFSSDTSREFHLTLPMVSDVGNRVSQGFRILYDLPSYLIDLFKKKGIILPQVNEVPTWQLPIAATYVIGKDGMVKANHLEVNHRTRMTPEEAIEALKKLS